MEKKEIFEKFNVTEKFISAVRHGNGHINDTFLVKTNGLSETKHYLLQKINHRVFKDIEGLMRNIEVITTYVNTKSTNSVYQKIIKTKDNKNYYFCDKSYTYWRVFTFIQDGIALNKITNPSQFYETGLAFGEFQKSLQNFKTSELIETIEDFHDTKKRFERFKDSVKNDLVNKARFAEEEINFLLSKKEYASIVVDLLDQNLIPYRVTHNDTKLDNVLFHKITGEALSIVDLDTIMPGSILYDFGDAIRFGANKTKEDETDLTTVGIDLNLFELFTKGFLKHTAEIMNPIEISHLAFSPILITYELSMRFLKDYLNGNIYFKVDDEEHNLRRARTQIALMKDMEKNRDKMELIVKRVYKDYLNKNIKQ